MNCINEIFRKTFEDTLDEHGNSYQQYADNIYSIAPKNKPDRITIAKLIGSEPIDEKRHGTKNDTEIKAIGYFRFKLSSEGIEPNFYIFAFSDYSDHRVEFVIIPFSELKSRLNKRKCITDKDQDTELRFWLLSDDLVFESNFGAEGEFWFVNGRMAKNTVWDYTPYLNWWDSL